MIESFIALISIFIDILGSNITGRIIKKYSFEITGNTIIGVFGSIFFIKTLDRIGFEPKAIMQTGEIDNILLIINFITSFFGEVVALFIAFIINKVINRKP